MVHFAGIDWDLKTGLTANRLPQDDPLPESSLSRPPPHYDLDPSLVALDHSQDSSGAVVRGRGQSLTRHEKMDEPLPVSAGAQWHINGCR